MAVAEMLHLEAVGLILFIVEGFELVNGDLMELVEIRRHKDLLVCYFFHSIAFHIFVHFSRWIVTGPRSPDGINGDSGEGLKFFL